MPGIDTATLHLLGSDVNINNTASTEQGAFVIEGFKIILKKINLTPLPVKAKLQALCTKRLSKLIFYFFTLTFSMKDLVKMENEKVKYVRK